MIASAPLATSLADTHRASGLLRSLHRELIYMVGPEMSFTMTVAVLSAAGNSRREIARILEAEEVELKMAFQRLKRVAKVFDEA